MVTYRLSSGDNLSGTISLDSGKDGAVVDCHLDARRTGTVSIVDDGAPTGSIIGQLEP